MEESKEDILDSANNLLQTFNIDHHTPVDTALLLVILGISIDASHQLRDLKEKVRKMALDLTGLQTSANDAVALLETLAANSDNSADQAAVDAVAQQLANAVQANTPAPVEPTPEPAPAA